MQRKRSHSIFHRMLFTVLAYFGIILIFGSASERVIAQPDVKDSQYFTFSSQRGDSSNRNEKQGWTANGRALQGDLMEFFSKAYPVTQLLLPRSELHIHCQKHVNEVYVTFVGFEDGMIFLVVLTQKEFKKPGKNILIAHPKQGLSPGGTMNWGYVFDRNHDGKVDYLAFLDGQSPVIPDDWKGSLPNLTKAFSGKDFKETITPNIKLLFWHMADDNFDGYHDGVAASMRNLETGWIDGWIVARDREFYGRYDYCKYFQGKFKSEIGDCEGSPSGYHVPKKKPSGIENVPPSHWFFEQINTAAEICRLSGDSFYKREW